MFLDMVHAGSLYFIGRDLAHCIDPNNKDIQDSICRKYGRSLYDITPTEAEYIMQVAKKERGY